MTAFLLISTGILLLIAVPIGMAMGTASLLTILQGGTLNALIITQKLLSGVSKFSLLAIPMFTLAGEVMTLGGVSDKAHLPGQPCGRPVQRRPFHGHHFGLHVLRRYLRFRYRYGRCHRRHHGRAHGKSRL